MKLWLLITEKLATLEELETIWSLDDVERMYAVLEFRKALESETQKALDLKRKK